MAKATQVQPKKRGFNDAMVALVSVFMIMSPSYLADMMMSGLKVPVAAAAIFALAVFLGGIFLLVRLLRD
jgi:hydrogenase-4 membrane subunit HyfE